MYLYKKYCISYLYVVVLFKIFLKLKINQFKYDKE